MDIVNVGDYAEVFENSALPVRPIKPREAAKEHDVEVRLLLNLAAPVPRRREATVNARTAVIASAVEPVPEEVTQDSQLGGSWGGERFFHVPPYPVVFGANAVQ